MCDSLVLLDSLVSWKGASPLSALRSATLPPACLQVLYLVISPSPPRAASLHHAIEPYTRMASCPLAGTPVLPPPALFASKLLCGGGKGGEEGELNTWQLSPRSLVCTTLHSLHTCSHLCPHMFIPVLRRATRARSPAVCAPPSTQPVRTRASCIG